MSDIKTVFIDMTQGADYALDALGLTPDDGLETAVIISLFTDRRANVDDSIPDGSNDFRGWWADAFNDVEHDKIGSRLWLLSREKQLPSVLVRAREYALEALQWLVDDGVAQSITVEATNPRTGLLALAVLVFRPLQPVSQYRFDLFWKS
jgi:phage gp46-like protein